MKEKPKPCSHCHNSDVDVARITRHDGALNYAVCCEEMTGCGMQGPMSETKEQAISTWNALEVNETK